MTLFVSSSDEMYAQVKCSEEKDAWFGTFYIGGVHLNRECSHSGKRQRSGDLSSCCTAGSIYHEPVNHFIENRGISHRILENLRKVLGIKKKLSGKRPQIK